MASGQAKQIEVVMEQAAGLAEALKALIEPPPPPPPERAGARPACRARQRSAWASAAPTDTATPRAPGFCQIRGHCFGRDCLDRVVEVEHLLLLDAEPPDRNRPLLRLALADHEHHRHLGERVLAHLVVDLLVAEVGLGAQPGAPQRLKHLAGIGVGVGDDRRDHACTGASHSGNRPA